MKDVHVAILFQSGAPLRKCAILCCTGCASLDGVDWGAASASKSQVLPNNDFKNVGSDCRCVQRFATRVGETFQL